MYFLRFLVFSLIFGANYAISPELKEAIDSAIENFMLSNKIPGTTFAILENNQVTTAGYGLKNVAENLPVDEKTHFLIGSISKSITSLIVANELEKLYPGGVDQALDMPVKFFLPNDVMFSDRMRTDSISFRDLLSHRACVDQNDQSVLSFDNYVSYDEYIYRSRYRIQNCYFRNSYVYNNPMYDMAGYYISLLTGKSLGQLFSEFFQSVGMTNSRILLESDDFESMSNFALPYVINPTGDLFQSNTSLLYMLRHVTAAGGVMSSSEDMAKYMHFLLNLGKNTDGVQVFPEAVVRATRKNSMPQHPNYGLPEFDSTYGYGLGLDLSYFNGHEIVMHGGYYPPYQSQMTVYTDINLAIFTSHNGPGATYLTLMLHTQIYNIIMGKQMKENSLDFQVLKDNFFHSHKLIKPYDDAKTHEHSNFKQFQSKNSNFAGLFGNAHWGDVTIEFRADDPNGELYFRMGKWATGYMKQDPVSGYLVEIDSDLVHSEWAAGNWFDIKFWAGFPDVNTLHMGDENFPVIFKRNATIDTFPSQPWLADSCVPE